MEEWLCSIGTSEIGILTLPHQGDAPFPEALGFLRANSKKMTLIIIEGFYEVAEGSSPVRTESVFVWFPRRTLICST
jgi:hypothetical protein